MTPRTRTPLAPQTLDLGAGIRLHVLRTRQFTTTICRVVAHRPLDADAATAAILANVLASATESLPSREALADRLSELYGGALHCGVGKLGDRQLLSATLEWPTSHVASQEPALRAGLALLREVWSRPQRGPDGLMCAEYVTTERRNLRRALAGLRSDKAAFTLRALVEDTCRGEPFALDARGTVAAADAVTAESLDRLHADILTRAPIDVWIVGDVPLRAAERAVRRHLLWPGRGARTRRRPPASSTRPARSRPRHTVLEDDVNQARLALAWRAPVRPTTRAAAGLIVLAGVLGGGSYGRLFKVVREQEGLCYDASAFYSRPKGLLVVQTGVDPRDERRARRSIRRLFREVAGGHLDEESHAAFLEEQSHRLALLGESRGEWVGWLQASAALGLTPDVDQRLELIRRVTPADVRRAARGLALDSTVVLRPAGGQA